MLSFLTGPGVWIACIICIGGLSLKLAYLYGLSRGKDQIFYNHMDLKWGIKSIVSWMIPLGSVSLRTQPVFGISVFVFHITLLLTPIFLDAHQILFDEAFGIRLGALPDNIADILTIGMIISGIFLLLRRLVRPEVKIITSVWDYVLLLLTMLPFITGFMATHHWGHYETIFMLHVLSAEILLIIIPFTKLSHVVLFFFSRAFIGFEMGTRRGARAW